MNDGHRQPGRFGRAALWWIVRRGWLVAIAIVLGFIAQMAGALIGAAAWTTPGMKAHLLTGSTDWGLLWRADRAFAGWWSYETAYGVENRRRHPEINDIDLGAIPTVRFQSIPPTMRAPNLVDQAQLNRGQCLVVVAGWPFRSFGTQYTMGPNPTKAMPRMVPTVQSGDLLRDVLPAGLLTRLSLRDGNIIPYDVLWQGAIVNTVVWSIPFALLLLGIAPMRRTMRRRRKRCISCGYDLSTSPNGVCPECGPG
jgi:hypothetical protein